LWGGGKTILIPSVLKLITCCIKNHALGYCKRPGSFGKTCPVFFVFDTIPWFDVRYIPFIFTNPRLGKSMKIPVVKEILNANDQVAAEVREIFDRHGVFVLNLMASPGAGKTSFILATVDRLPNGVRPGVIEGDLASSIDADTIAARGVSVVQINTGGGCHLDAPMIKSALPHLPVPELDLLFIENVGNLVCPANFNLGANMAVVVASVPEGHDKPYKYPGMFAAASVVILNKADMIDVFEFDVDYFRRGVVMVNPHAPLFVLSCRSGAGVPEWINWLQGRIELNELKG
jgi:hydrogenase nickel incorporation protein HypB